MLSRNNLGMSNEPRKPKPHKLSFSGMSSNLKQAFTKNKQKTEENTPMHEYFRAHQCNIPADKVNTHQIKYGRQFKQRFFDLTSVNMRDVRAKNLYRSYSALSAEKYRQYRYYTLSIHPFSKIRVWLEVIVVISLMAGNTMLVLDVTEPGQRKVQGPIIIIISIFVICECVYVINIVTNFFTGYVEGTTHKHVVLDLKRIAFHYMKTWLVLDIVSTLSIVPALSLNLDEPFSIYWDCTVLAMKIFRIPILLRYLNNVLVVWKIRIFKKTIIETSVMIITYVLWNMYFQFAVAFIREGTMSPETPNNCSWVTMARLWDAKQSTRFTYSLDRAVGMLRKNANINLVERRGCIETFFIVAWIIAKLLVYHCAFKYFVFLVGKESPKSKYFLMTKQVETLMNNKKFPPRIKEKILKFYAIRFQSNYSAEMKMLRCVTGQLRQDIIMYTGRRLVEEIEFLKHLPRSLLLQIGLKLKIVIFIAGDIIFKINTVGDCLYFIDRGTVAIYSESGYEICHLEDGDYFGEIALVTKHLRTASAVAVTNCELFRLDKEDFDSSIACYPTVYEYIKKVAINRYERTRVLDEHHQAELKIAEDHVVRELNNSQR